MQDFSIETGAEKIYNPQTKEYFKEVLSSYFAGNYRSAIVMLWSVIICDLIYKLQYLENVFLDQSASSILKEIEQMQLANPTSPQWEIELLKMIKERTHMLELVEYHNLENVQKHRHLCAHPAVNAQFRLYMANKDIARAHIRNALEDLLIKAPTLHKKIFNVFLADIEQIQHVMNPNQLLRYIDEKYFKGLTFPVKVSFIKGLWKMIFRLDDKRCNDNRYINYEALTYLYAKHPGEFLKIIKQDKDYYSSVGSSAEQVKYLVNFLSHFPEVYSHLTDAAKPIVEQALQRDFNLYTNAWFLCEGDLQLHLKELKKIFISRLESGQYSGINYESFRTFIETYRGQGFIREVIDLAIFFYSNTGSFAQADSIYENAISPLLLDLNSEELIKIIEGIQSNGQTRERYKAGRDHSKFKLRCDEVLGTGFDYSNYDKFLSSF